MSWSITFYNTDGTGRGTLGLTDPVESIPSMIVGPDGDCKEAILRVVVADLPFTLLPRGVVTISADGAQVFTGYLATLGRAFGRELSTLKLVGLRERFFEVNARRPVVGTDAGQTLNAAVTELINDAINPTTTPYGSGLAGVTYLSSTVVVPGLSVGKILPGFAFYGTIFDELAAQGLTGTSWGVDATGTFFFRVPTGTLEVDEITDGTLVEWQDVDADAIVTGLTWVLPGGTTNSIQREAVAAVTTANYQTTHAPYVLAHESLSPDASAYGRIMRTVAPPSSVSPFKPGGWTSINGNGAVIANLANAMDDDPSTFGTITLNASGSAELIAFNTTYQAWVGANMVFEQGVSVNGLTVGVNDEGGTGTYSYFDNLAFGFGTSGLRNGILLDADKLASITAFRAANPSAESYLVIQIKGPVSTAVKVYDIRPLSIDAVTLDKLASAYFVSPVVAAGSVTVRGIVPPALTVNIRRRDENLNDLGLVTLPAEQLEYVIDREGYKITRIRVGQRFDPETQGRIGLSRWQNDDTALRAISFVTAQAR